MNDVIVTLEENIERKVAATQHCPFRVHRRSYGDDFYEDLMQCDPKCAALVYDSESESWSCLRLVRVSTNVDKICLMNVPED